MNDVGQLEREITASYKIDAADLNALDDGHPTSSGAEAGSSRAKARWVRHGMLVRVSEGAGLNPCMGFIEDAYTLACEGDVMLCISLLLVRYLAGTGAYVGDLYDLDLDGILTLIHCGAPASLASNREEVVRVKI